jgi:hypothetical protein
MTMERAWPLQIAVVGRINAASSLPVHTEVPEDPPKNYVRIDGFTGFELDTYKNYDQMQHSFTVHVFQQDTGDLGLVRQELAAIHAALIAEKLDGAASKLRIESTTADFDPEAGGGQTAHANTRYSTRIGA